MNTLSADLAILMPKITDIERFTTRYTDLSDALGALGVSVAFAESHDSYDGATRRFNNPLNVLHENVGDYLETGVVRDLTMPAGDKPLYDGQNGMRLAHHPETNRFLADKRNMLAMTPDVHPASAVVDRRTVTDALDMIPGDKVVIKPVRGMASKDVQVISKSELRPSAMADGDYILQEFIDTSRGIASLGIEGMHNVRMISIGNAVVGSIARIGGTEAEILKDDIWGNFIDNDSLPDSMHVIADMVHTIMTDLPGSGQNVIAIDVMRGIGADGEQTDVLCEVNRRPIRISTYDLGKHLDDDAIRTMARHWDKAEAAMLAKMVS